MCICDFDAVDLDADVPRRLQDVDALIGGYRFIK